MKKSRTKRHVDGRVFCLLGRFIPLWLQYEPRIKASADWFLKPPSNYYQPRGKMTLSFGWGVPSLPVICHLWVITTTIKKIHHSGHEPPDCHSASLGPCPTCPTRSLWFQSLNIFSLHSCLVFPKDVRYVQMSPTCNFHLEASWNGGIPNKSSILVGFSLYIYNHLFWVPTFMETSISISSIAQASEPAIRTFAFRLL